MQNESRRYSTVVVAALCALSQACSPDADEPARAITSALYQYPSTYQNLPVNTWPNGQVPICFTGSGGALAEAQWIKDALKDTWSAVSVIDFSYQNGCPFSGQSLYVALTLTDCGPTGTFNCIGGNASPPGAAANTPLAMSYCTTTSCTVTNLVDYKEVLMEVAAHEVGHKLGFTHEQQRPDYTTLDCPSDNGTDGNNVTISGGTYRTASPDKDSILNYCRRPDSNGVPLPYQAGYHAAEKLSSGDAFGVQQVYGVRFAYWLEPALTLPLI